MTAEKKFSENKSSLNMVPEKLKPGDTLGIVATASVVDLEKPLIQKGFDFLKSKGFSLIEAPNLYQKTGHIAGGIEERVNAFHAFIENPQIKGIMAFWGGYNSNQLLDRLDYELIAKNPKVIIGYSDFSVITTAITKMSRIVTYCGPSVITFSKPGQFDYTWQYFSKMCLEDNQEIVLVPSSQEKDDGYKVFKSGNSQGEIIAANLISLASLVGTKYCPDFSGKILFLEEAEYANTAMIDRALTQLRQAEVFSQCHGIVFGRFPKKSGFNDNDSLESLLTAHFDGLDKPIVYNVDFGHTDPIFTVPSGGQCDLQVTDNVTITVKA